MVPDSSNLIVEAVAASIRDAGGLRGISVLPGDHLKDLGLSRLRQLAVLIELEDKFAIEFPSEAVDCFRMVGDVALYIQSHEMTPYDHAADELPTAARSPDIGVRNSRRRDERTGRNTSSAIGRP
jgi:acyl carrier protein